MKIIGFSQLYNEHKNKNLEYWFNCMNTVCDKIYIYDQCSTDYSKTYYKKFDNTVVVESMINNFSNELICKQKLLDKLLTENPDTDWILWLDGDTLLDNRLLNREILQELCNRAAAQSIDAISLGHLNLWRSDIHYRVDSNYDYFDKAGRCPLWRNNGQLKFNVEAGLHKHQEPYLGFKNVAAIRDYKLIHRGFATDQQIIDRYKNYKSRGQTGNDLTRLIDEATLATKVVDNAILPPWYMKLQTLDPINRPKIKSYINE